ncbi:MULTISPECIES: DNA polymerase III subunit gamma/tau [Chitinophagaceae]
MEKFVVSARKYRPQTFDTVVGQSHITTTLKNAIKNNQLAHAYLFCGPRGVGKTTCARIFAKTINCEHPTPDGEACDQCNSCKSFNEGTSLNISELDAASNNSVEDIRTLVEQVRFTPQAGKYKVYIIDEVHMLSQAAFNAFLKTLEEPPSYVVFILATTEKHKLLPTILSRCQIFDFKRITNNDTVEHLASIATKEHVDAEKAALQIIAQKSEGCMRDALSIMDKIVSFTGGKLSYQNTLENLNILDDEYYFQILDCFQNEDLAGALLLYNEVNRKGFEGDIFINGLQDFLRNLLVCKNPKAADLLDVVAGFEDRYRQKSLEVSASYIVSALNVLNDAEIGFKAARNKRLHIEMALIKLNYLQQAIMMSGSENAVVQKKRRVDGPIAFKVKNLSGVSVKNNTSKTVQPVQTQSNPSSSKLFIEAKEEKLVARESKPVVPQTVVPASAPAPAASRIPKGDNLLDSLFKQFDAQKNDNTDSQTVPLALEKAQEVWNQFSEQLIRQDKTSAGNAFRVAILEVQSPETLLVKVHSVVQQKFVEAERIFFMEKLKAVFKNKDVNFVTEVLESDDTTSNLPVSLSAREKFEIMIRKNPAILDLRNLLQLNLD